MAKFKIKNNTIYFGKLEVPGHGCSSVEEMEKYCDKMNNSYEAKLAKSYKKLMKDSDKKIKALPDKYKQEIIDFFK